MIDTQEFGRRFRDKLLTITAENQGVGRIEAVRRYHTDATFHAMVETIAMAATQTLLDMEGTSRLDPLREVFDEEASGLLGWER